MQIPDEVRKCTAFLACKREKSGYENRGTVFFAAYPLADGEGSGVPYAITARHVIEELRIRGDGKVYCRLNTRAHGVQYVEIPSSQWSFHSDSRIDVAVAPISLDLKLFDHTFVNLDMFITQDVLADQEIGIGDDLFFPGLFTQRPGEKANLPILRVGNIAAMPEEPIAVKGRILRPSYLVEARSIGGLSGSPVFWYRGPGRMKSMEWQLGHFHLLFYLLGLVHGHYVSRESMPDSSESTIADWLGADAINTGIAIVIPADDIRATLDHPELRQQRERHRQWILAARQMSLPVPDAVGFADIVTQVDTGARTESASAVSEQIESSDTAEIQRFCNESASSGQDLSQTARSLVWILFSGRLTSVASMVIAG